MRGVDWMASAQCRDLGPQVMHPTDGHGVIDAKRVCAACPVKEPCLEYALATRQEYGVWGGTSERQRRRMHSRHLTVVPTETVGSDQPCCDCGADVGYTGVGRPPSRCRACRTARTA